MSIPSEEQETTINYNRKENICSIWTCDSTVMTKLDKIYPCHKEHKAADGSIWAKEYSIPKNLISFRCDERIKPKNPPKRVLSEKQIAVLKKMRDTREQEQASL